MKTLALDIGTRRTGCAYYDDVTGVPLPIDTLTHVTLQEFAEKVGTLVRARGVTRIVAGLPLLPSGGEGRQSESVRSYVAALESLQIQIVLFDERYTTPKASKGDGDASAALSILQTYLEKNGS
jgi:putative transcription antitermination factor YqgF